MRSPQSAQDWMLLCDKIVAFNYPEHCRTGSTQFPEPSPCWSAGAGNPVDGAIPEASHFVAAFGAKVAESDRVQFVVDLMQDTPTEVFHGSGLTNPSGAWIAVGVLDKGPALPDTDPLRAAQFDSIRGACEGPPSFGPLRCEFAGVQQHLSQVAHDPDGPARELGQPSRSSQGGSALSLFHPSTGS